MARPIHEIAREISREWPNVHFAAKPYLDAMHDLRDVSDMYGYDSAPSIIRYFLANARGWRGPVAKAVKAELKAMIKGKYASAKSDRSQAVKLASALPKGDEHRRGILARLAQEKAARTMEKLIIEVGEDPKRVSETFPKGQPYVKFSGTAGGEKYYLVARAGSSRGGKFGEWRNEWGVMPLPALVEIANMLLEGKMR
jgi:hypothetical protein